MNLYKREIIKMIEEYTNILKKNGVLKGSRILTKNYEKRISSDLILILKNIDSLVTSDCTLI